MSVEGGHTLFRVPRMPEQALVCAFIWVWLADCNRWHTHTHTHTNIEPPQLILSLILNLSKSLRRRRRSGVGWGRRWETSEGCAQVVTSLLHCQPHPEHQLHVIQKHQDLTVSTQDNMSTHTHTHIATLSWLQASPLLSLTWISRSLTLSHLGAAAATSTPPTFISVQRHFSLSSSLHFISASPAVWATLHFLSCYYADSLIKKQTDARTRIAIVWRPLAADRLHIIPKPWHPPIVSTNQ